MSHAHPTPYVRRFSNLGNTSAIVYECTHPDPARGVRRAVSRAKTLARADACLPGNRDVWYAAYSMHGSLIYTSSHDPDIQTLLNDFPIDRRSYPYARPPAGLDG